MSTLLAFGPGLMSSNFMRQQAMGSKMLYGRPIPVARIVQGISDRKLICPAFFVTELNLQVHRTIPRCTVNDLMELVS
jgi:hypothetical protein